MRSGVCLAVLVTSVLAAACQGSGLDELRLAAIGDVLLDRSPGERLRLVGGSTFFGPLKHVMEGQDVVFANLESPFASRAHRRTDKPADLTFSADPRLLTDLAGAGISVVSLANNHLDDGGADGIVQTIEALDSVGIAHAGAGSDEGEAHRAAVVIRGSVRLAFLSYNHVETGVLPAGPHRPGIAWAEVSSMRRDIQRVKQEVHPTAIVVSVHWGNEFESVPTSFQREFGRACIREGAMLVLGHHPHVLQGFERVGEGLIAYSLGNAVFSMPGEETESSVALLVELRHNASIRAVAVPMVISRFLGSPRPATGADRERILNKLRSRSPGLIIDEEGRLN